MAMKRREKASFVRTVLRLTGHRLTAFCAGFVVLTLVNVLAPATVLAATVSYTVDGWGPTQYPGPVTPPANAPWGPNGYPGDTLELLTYTGTLDLTPGSYTQKLNTLAWKIDYTYAGTATDPDAWSDLLFSVDAMRNISFGAVHGSLSQTGSLEVLWDNDYLTLNAGPMISLFVQGQSVDITPLGLVRTGGVNVVPGSNPWVQPSYDVMVRFDVSAPCENVVCTALDQCHDTGTCDPLTGQCSNPAKPEGTPCGDNNPCTTNDACDGAGLCVGGPAPNCDDGNACTDDSCNPTALSVTAGYRPHDADLIGVRFRSLGNTGADELYLGVPDLGVQGNRTARNFGYCPWGASNAITFTFDKAADNLVATVDTGAPGCSFSLTYPGLTASLATRKPGFLLSEMNIMQMTVVARDANTTVSLQNVMFNGTAALGTFTASNPPSQWLDWMVTGPEFNQSFTMTATLNLTGAFGGSQELSKAEIKVGVDRTLKPSGCETTFTTSGTPCGDSSSGPCDNADTCDGAGACQTNHVADGTNCGDAGGACINQDTCLAGSCHDNGFKSAATPCTGASQGGACDNDAADHCLGTANTCVDAFKPSSTVCRAAAGQCDVAENCAGSSANCPADAKKPAGTACDSFADTCSLADTCDSYGVCQNTGGGGDTDGDGVCEADDNCPTVANANQYDTNEDGVGDACDSHFAANALIVWEVRLKADSSTQTDNGSIRVKARVIANPPLDVFPVAVDDGGVTIKVEGAGLAGPETTTFKGDQCTGRATPKGLRVTCVVKDGHTTVQKLVLSPANFYANQYNLNLVASRRNFPPPLTKKYVTVKMLTSAYDYRDGIGYDADVTEQELSPWCKVQGSGALKTRCYEKGARQ